VQLITLFNNNSFQWRPARQNELTALTLHVTPGPDAIDGVADGDAAHHRHASRRLGPSKLATPKGQSSGTILIEPITVGMVAGSCRTWRGATTARKAAALSTDFASH
jgi:hypothetical protein